MRSSFFSQYRAWLVLAILPWLASCGGGGGGGGGEACGSCSIGGTVSGLTGTVVLQLNGAGGTNVSANGGFSFPTPQPNGTTFAVTVLTQPVAQRCFVGNGTGVLSGSNVTNVAVSCVPSSATIGGTISGLVGTVVLQNGADTLSRSLDGGFTFPAVPNGGSYAVTVLTQPAGQVCSVTNGAGTVGGASVTGVTVICSAASFSVGGTVSGLAGTLVLRNNGGDDLTLSADGPFAFASPVAQGSAYSVTVFTQPGKQSCSVTGGSGAIAGANVSNVAITCVNLNLMFVTSTTSDGNLGGFSGADAKCNTLAGAAGLPGSYVAWLSDINHPPAVVRLGSSRGWVRPDGLPFVDTVDDIKSAKIMYPPRIDETGAAAPSGSAAFTNTSFFNGNPSTTGADCGGWTTSSGTIPLGGIPDGGGIAWTEGTVVSCNQQNRLYCFGTGSGAPLNSAPPTGRFAFQSSAAFTSGSGRAVADAVCQSEASGAGLPGTYKALLAAAGSSAASRFTAGAAWVRPDGVRVFASAADLLTTTLTAPVAVTATGSYVGAFATAANLNPRSEVWIGASSFSAPGTAFTTCLNWSSSSANDFGSIAPADRSVPPIFLSFCNSPRPLICLQE